MKIACFALGAISVVLGIVGIFVPILPTTPFLLLAAFCFAKSSPKLYDKFLDNKIFGGYIRNYTERKGMTNRHKKFIMIFLWTTIAYSAIFATESLWLRLLLLAVALAVTVHLNKISTLKGGKDEKN